MSGTQLQGSPTQVSRSRADLQRKRVHQMITLGCCMLCAAGLGVSIASFLDTTRGCMIATAVLGGAECLGLGAVIWLKAVRHRTNEAKMRSMLVSMLLALVLSIASLVTTEAQWRWVNDKQHVPVALNIISLIFPVLSFALLLVTTVYQLVH